jgi:hypothetical protein
MITEDTVDGPVLPERGRESHLRLVRVLGGWMQGGSGQLRLGPVMYPLEDQFYGERGGRLRDPFGQQWMMSQHIEDVPAGEMARRAAAFFSGQ